MGQPTTPGDDEPEAREGPAPAVDGGEAPPADRRPIGGTRHRRTVRVVRDRPGRTCRLTDREPGNSGP